MRLFTECQGAVAVDSSYRSRSPQARFDTVLRGPMAHIITQEAKVQIDIEALKKELGDLSDQEVEFFKQAATLRTLTPEMVKVGRTLLERIYNTTTNEQTKMLVRAVEGVMEVMNPDNEFLFKDSDDWTKTGEMATWAACEMLNARGVPSIVIKLSDVGIIVAMRIAYIFGYRRGKGEVEPPCQS